MARDLALNALKEHLVMAQNKMKKQADLHKLELQFNVGDEVFFKLRSYRQRSLARKRCEKLAPKFYGSYKVLERIREVAYRLSLPPEVEIHNVFHISQLKKLAGQRVQVQDHHPALTEEFELQVVPETIMGSDGTVNWLKMSGWLNGRICQRVKQHESLSDVA